MFTQLLSIVVLLPLLGFAGILLAPRKREGAVFGVAMAAMALELITLLVVGYRWFDSGAAAAAVTAGTVHIGQSDVFSLAFYFDRLAAVFLGTSVVMTMLIFIFSKYYLHREQGFKRFYSTIMLFFTGLALVILAGSFEVLFLGWELIGISSVLLIAFYRDRFLPARNALKVFSVYRIGDALLLAAIWYAHHMFEGSVRFSELSSLAGQHAGSIVMLGILLLLVAMIKSAQFPFSYWLPRAMEGPTTSSAIFYGALSVHMGLFLLLRMYPLWGGSTGLRIAVAAVGLATAVVASSIARVQSSAKTQVAYASITQIGIMFIELAAGLQWLVLLHFVSNASLRTYQLLISPSVVSYLTHDQFFHFVPPLPRIKDGLLGKLRATLYILGIKEWSMNTAVSRYMWQPLKAIGRACAFLDSRSAQGASLAVLVLLLAAVLAVSSAGLLLAISTTAAIASIIFYIRAYTTKNAARTGWNLIMLGHLFGALFLVSATTGGWGYLILYGAGVLVAFIVGHICLRYLERNGESNMLRDYQGSIQAFRRTGNLFFIVSLLFMAFPISPSFLAQDMLVSLIPKAHAFQLALFCLSYLLAGVSTIRLYMKVSFGPHKTSYHEMAYKSS